MFIVELKKWQPSLAVGQEHFIVDAWFEAVSDDASPFYWPPLYSTHQLLKNLWQIIADVQKGILKEHYVRDAAEEILDRIKYDSWLKWRYPEDLRLMAELIVDIRDHFTELEKRRNFQSLLGTFLNKVDAGEPIPDQFDYLAQLAKTDPTGKTRPTSFLQMELAVADVVHDLLHVGHSRIYLNHWWMKTLVSTPTDQRRYLTRLRDLSGLGCASDYIVILNVSARPSLPGDTCISFPSAIPSHVIVPSESPMARATKLGASAVDVGDCCDCYAAAEEGRRLLTRYLHSTRLDHMKFERSISTYSIVIEKNTNVAAHVEGERRLQSRQLFNDEAFYRLSPGARYEQTFIALDRILYWIEQGKRSADETQLIALWTAMEFLFSIPQKETVPAMIELLPAYVATMMCRLLLLDLWKFINRAKIVFLPTMETLLKVNRVPNREPKCDLLALFTICIEPEATNFLLPQVKDFPILERKIRKVRRLMPQMVLGGRTHTTLYEEIECLETSIKFDLNSIYRARNKIIHDAATDVAHLDRLSQRLNWLLTVTLDTLLFQFTQNPTLSLFDLHQANLASYRDWRAKLDTKLSPKEVLYPTRHFLSGSSK